MMTPRIAELILQSVQFPGMDFAVLERGDDFFLRVECKGTCNVTGAALNWSGRKWLLSKHMTKSEVVTTAFKAVMTAIEHETREKFTYKGNAVFGPHHDVERLVGLCERNEMDGRQ